MHRIRLTINHGHSILLPEDQGGKSGLQAGLRFAEVEAQQTPFSNLHALTSPISRLSRQINSAPQAKVRLSCWRE